MTDETMKAGRELDLLVAEKVMGCVWSEVVLNPPKSFHAWGQVGFGGEDDGKRIATYMCPEFSTDIGAAQEVLDQFSFGIQRVEKDSAFCVDIWDGWGREFLATAQSESLPHAICLAAIKAISAQSSSENPSVFSVRGTPK